MNRRSSSIAWGLVFSVLLCCGTFAWGAAPGDIGFNRQVRPVLADKCFVCHGPDSRARKADLRLDVRDEAVKERHKIQPIVPGDPDKSELVRRIFADNESDRMPPVKSHLTLTDAQKQLLREWVRQGARYEAHWSLIPVPENVPLPPVQNTAWPRNDLDRFVLARLEAEKLAPAPEASSERWLRRVSFDLTGLPPTRAEIDAFMADMSPQAHEHVVDRLLASPKYGEKLTTSWLDVARYADSFGYQADLDTKAWPYRDWVIQACNDNLPYDKFITWQIAGDLLPNATRSQRLATAFCRIHRKTQEGGSIETEFRQDGINDRINTFGTAFLGLTVECARCHDHKYDPITMRDFYSLGSFFNSIDEWGLLHGNGAIQPYPILDLPTPGQEKELAARRDAVASAESALAQTHKEREPAFQAWLAQPHESVVLPVDLAGAYDFEHAVENKLRNAAHPKEPGTFNPADSFVLARTGHGIKFTGDDAVNVTTGGARHREDPLSVAFWLMPAEEYPRAVVFHNTQGADPGFNGFELVIEHGQLRWMVVREWPGNCIAIRSLTKLPVQSWTHVAVSYDGSARAAGLRIYLNGRPADVEVLRDRLTRDCGDGGKIDLGERFRDAGFRNGVMDEMWIFSRSISPIEVTQLYDGSSLADLVSPKDKTEAQIASLREYYLSAVDEPARASAKALHKARSEYRQLIDQVREIPVMEEMQQPRPAFILARGAYDAPKEQVSRETPAALPFPSGAPRNRLGLAQWLTQPNHPLTARVAVNRFWQDLFGRGLIVTAENFGTQGQPPSHPELLDWLARDFVSHGWDIKRFYKQIVLSASYRQDSRAPKELRERDPENVLLGRGPSRRLSAEELRDNALALSGLLRPEIGGPPVYPYAPEAAMGRSLNNFLPEYKRDKGAGLYRRSMYTFWRRTTPPPDMLVFDSATREICTARRQLTLTPLQPLVLLNDPQFVEASRALGERMMREGGETLDKQLAWAFIGSTGRPAATAELEVLRALYNEQLALFQKVPADATKLLQVGDFKNDAKLPADQLAAATMVASALLNLDATIVLR